MPSKNSTVPHDYIYGVLGLIGLAKLPAMLMPDYHRPYEEVCSDYTKFLIDGTGSLGLLGGDGAGRLDGQPTWVTDFRFVPWNTDQAELLHTGYFLSDGRTLEVEWTLAHRLQLCLPKSMSLGEAGRKRRMLQFHGSMLVDATKIRRQPLSMI